MKVYMCVLVFLLQQMHSTADLSWFSKLKLGPECITLSQLYNATATMCTQKDNTALWEKVIRCHDPLTENIGACLVAGSFMPLIETHHTEVNDVKDLWGDEVPCNIGKCILALGLGVGA